MFLSKQIQSSVQVNLNTEVFDVQNLALRLFFETDIIRPGDEVGSKVHETKGRSEFRSQALSSAHP